MKNCKISRWFICITLCISINVQAKFVRLPMTLVETDSIGLTPCSTPTAAPTSLNFSSVTTSTVSGSFVSAGADEYLVVLSVNNLLTAMPVNGIRYNTNDSLGGGIVVQQNSINGFYISNLTASTTYYFFIFSANSNNCTNGPVYLTSSSLQASQTTNPIVTTAYNFYNGNLHSHSSYSDGNKDSTLRIPTDDYAFAKTAMCMDFLGISEHNHLGAGMHLADWQPGAVQAAAATTTNFVALHGMEWGLIGVQGASGDHEGHVIVYGVDSLIGWEPNNYQIYVPKDAYIGTGGLFDIVNNHGQNAIAVLAHPDNYDYNNLLNSAFDANADNAIVGSAIESGPAFSTDTTYSNLPSSLAYYSYYKNMLAKGYHLGPTIDHDNHYFTFGHTAKSRLIILADSLSENNLLNAMKQMRFYASEDCGAKINFTINQTSIGSITRQAGMPTILVNGVTSMPITSIKIMSGVPGSGAVATILASTTASSINYTHTALTNLATNYYYIDITESNGARIITAPIWYTRQDLPTLSFPSLVSFFTIQEKDKNILKWITNANNIQSNFEIQRSIDGINFTSIGNILSKETSNYLSTYIYQDLNPINEIAYYRIVQHNNDGAIHYSELKVIDRGAQINNSFMVYPNPVHGQLTIKIVSNKLLHTSIDLYDMIGKKISSTPINVAKGIEQTTQLNLSNLVNGNYILKMKYENELLTRMVYKF